MKYLLFSLFALLIIFSGCAVFSRAAAEQGELFSGSAQGYRGQIAVQVRMNGSQIAGIVITDSDEDRFVGGAAIEELIDLVIMYNTADLDAISGATESSRGFLEAVQNAIIGR